MRSLPRVIPVLGLLLMFVCVRSDAAVIVSVENKTVVGNPDFSTVAFVEVFVSNDDPLQLLSAFQVQVKVDIPLQFYSADNTEDHPQLLNAEPLFQQSTSSTILAAKLAPDPVPLADNGGLARLTVNIPAATYGTFPVRLVSMAQDPDFGTAITGGEDDPIPLEITLVNGTLTVVPEPVCGVVISGLLAGLRRPRCRH